MTDDALQQPRQPLPWRSDMPLRVLSLDGGGTGAIFPSAILAFLEGTFLTGNSVGDYFDLIAGTAMGGILALGLGAGLTASEVLEMYLEDGHRLLPPRRRGLRRWLKGGTQPSFNRLALDRMVSRKLGSKNLRRSKYRLLIPSTEARQGQPWIFRTPHHPDYRLCGDESMRAVAAATTASPTCFASLGRTGHAPLDGGTWANNPVMAAVAEALSCFAVQREDIRVLSIGRAALPLSAAEGSAGDSPVLRRQSIVDVAMSLQSSSALSQASLLVGRERITRLDHPRPAESARPDDWKRNGEILQEDAVRVAEESREIIRTTFLTRPALPYSPFA